MLASTTESASNYTTNFLYDGGSLVGEYDIAGTMLRRGACPVPRHGVPSPDLDQPLVWYEGSGLSTKRFFHADNRCRCNRREIFLCWPSSPEERGKGLHQ
jgi:hypothetical protein